jgi:APA family basic amino acid/polyamine antiporter
MSKSNPSFHRSLTLFDSTALVMGSMVGSGIFIVSADIARSVGSPGWLLVVWGIAGILTIFAALGYGELAGMMPHAGGIYVYLREAYSPLVGFLYGWTLFLVIQCGTIAAVAMAFGKYLGVMVPWVSDKNVLIDYGFVHFNATQLIAIISILFLTWLNGRGVEQGKRVQNIFTLSKVLILLVFIGVGFMFAGHHPVGFWEATKITIDGPEAISGWPLIVAIGAAMVGSLFASDAWYDITFASGEVVNPKRNIPRSLIYGTIGVTILYLLINLVYIYVLPLTGSANETDVAARGIQYASEDRVATAVMQQILGQGAVLVMAGIVVVSTFGCNNGLILSGARVYYAMASDGLFFKNAGLLNSKGVPATGLWVQAAWCIVLCLSGSYSQLLDYIIMASLIFFILTILAVFVFRYKQPDLERPYKTFGYPVIPAIYILICLFIEVILLIYKPDYTWPGLIIVLSGIPVYYLWKYFNRTNPQH